MNYNSKQARREAGKREVRKALPLIERIRREKQGQDWFGMQTCPICQKEIYIFHYRNGTYWGQCETTNCIAWGIKAL